MECHDLLFKSSDARSPWEEPYILGTPLLVFRLVVIFGCMCMRLCMCVCVCVAAGEYVFAGAAAVVRS